SRTASYSARTRTRPPSEHARRISNTGSISACHRARRTAREVEPRSPRVETRRRGVPHVSERPRRLSAPRGDGGQPSFHVAAALRRGTGDLGGEPASALIRHEERAYAADEAYDADHPEHDSTYEAEPHDQE